MVCSEALEVVDPVTGVHTNNEETIHGVIKKNARNRDLVVWRANINLNKERSIWQQFLLDLRLWGKEPLDNFVRNVPLAEREPVLEDVPHFSHQEELPHLHLDDITNPEVPEGEVGEMFGD